ncbi:hypothetical protein BCR33DRAFT_737149 [Rhizoclosmatium globosum]|uniref:Uncharacterized protein n=1 Tax=Rhizoclosmatium globosum TaxID=329046 RepID=A0A1Y2CGB5_9FUNG|nr:hypothetical protein BCR33DRAFT_737149 [Rhizoclosmatium globosum]|eukprot:ORY46052.1 hypothetical protein BCR33DRAFT_737149 [Rhizoclosmatium globosum]
MKPVSRVAVTRRDGSPSGSRGVIVENCDTSAGVGSCRRRNHWQGCSRKDRVWVDLVRVVWSDRGMNLNVPERLVRARGNLLLQAEEEDDDIVFNDADEDGNDDEPMLATSNSLFRDKHRKNWVEKALFQRACPQVLDAWRLTKSNKAAGRRPAKNQTTPQSISKNQPSVASFFLKPSPAHAPNFPTVQSTITPQTASKTKPKYFVNLCSDDDEVSPGVSSSTSMLNPANGFDSDEEETPSERRKRLKSESDASNGTKPPPAPRKKTAFYKNMEEIARKPFPTSPKGKSRNLF